LVPTACSTPLASRSYRDAGNAGFLVESDMHGTVAHGGAARRLAAASPGRWDPVDVLKAYSRVHGNQIFDVDERTAKPESRSGIDEIRVARIVGADGLRTYMVRPPAGSPSTAFRHILDSANAGDNSATTTDEVASNAAVRRALRALEDVGLVNITLV
jgi:hypothetical protein